MLDCADFCCGSLSCLADCQPELFCAVLSHELLRTLPHHPKTPKTCPTLPQPFPSTPPSTTKHQSHPTIFLWRALQGPNLWHPQNKPLTCVQR